ncbi:MAG: dihydrodipicolinate synthase family protein, partial [Verrucomicrobiota bacterium]
MIATPPSAAIVLPPLRPRRTIDGISAVLLPFHPDGRPDRETWAALVERTWAAGLTPAVNMDTGYANLLSAQERTEFLTEAGRMARGRRFVAGTYIEGLDGDPSSLYVREATAIQEAGGTPILFPCSTIQHWDRAKTVSLFQKVGDAVPRFLGFELGTMFVPFGRIWDLDTFRALLEVPQLIGAKHSSLSRELEWQRLAVRDAVRPEFRVYTGNDLAIDLIQWGSDYLLGLSAFHVEAFAARDRAWARGDGRFHELNDWLQYLGMIAFRAPVQAYKHTCAQFLRLRGIIPSDAPHPRGARRPDSDLPILSEISQHLEALVTESIRASGQSGPGD